MAASARPRHHHILDSRMTPQEYDASAARRVRSHCRLPGRLWVHLRYRVVDDMAGPPRRLLLHRPEQALADRLLALSWRARRVAFSWPYSFGEGPR